MTWRRLAVWTLASACAAPPSPCGTEDCDCGSIPVDEADPIKLDGYAPTAFEVAALQDTIADIRQGIVAWDATSVGLCLGTHRCDGFLGLEPGVLPRGDYVLQAILRVPNAGPPDTWTLHLRTDCTITTYTGDEAKAEVRTEERDFSVSYAGMNRGFPLRPLAVIRSPLTDASMECTWSLESTHPGTPSAWSGSWSVPRESTP